jgi:hypothetical protein
MGSTGDAGGMRKFRPRAPPVRHSCTTPPPSRRKRIDTSMPK